MKSTLILILLGAALAACSHSDPEPATTSSEAVNEAYRTSVTKNEATSAKDQWLGQGQSDVTTDTTQLPAEPAPVVEATPPPPLPPSVEEATVTPQPLPAQPTISIVGKLTDQDVDKFIDATNKLAQLDRATLRPEDLQNTLSSANLTAPEYSVLTARIAGAAAVEQPDAAVESDQQKADREVVRKRLEEVKKALSFQ